MLGQPILKQTQDLLAANCRSKLQYEAQVDQACN